MTTTLSRISLLGATTRWRGHPRLEAGNCTASATLLCVGLNPNKPSTLNPKPSTRNPKP